MSDLKRFMDSWPLPEGEPFPGETLRADGWVYRDLPRLTYDAFDLFVSIVGEDNIRWLTRADYGNATRGQCFISPDGMRNMKLHVEAKTS